MPPTPTRTEIEPVLSVHDLRAYFDVDEGVVHAVDGVSFSVVPGQTLGIVGESGCGKSATARAMLQILGAGGRVVGGRMLLRRDSGVVDLARLGDRGDEIRGVRGNDVAMIFQEPMTAFAPVYSIGRQIEQALACHTSLSGRAAHARVLELLDQVRIREPERVASAYPFELSGGMLQRAMIAMALSCEPSVLIADEPTTALDVTIQAQILQLLKAVQDETGMAIVIISHNMGVIAEMADQVAVMYLGRIVEQAPVWDVFDRPRHPYTRALLRAIPMLEERVRPRLEAISGGVPSPYDAPAGCPFHPRCDAFMAGVCDREEPEDRAVTPEHSARCHLVGGEHG